MPRWGGIEEKNLAVCANIVSYRVVVTIVEHYAFCAFKKISISKTK